MGGAEEREEGMGKEKRGGEAESYKWH